MIGLQKLTWSRTNGADTVIVPPKLMEDISSSGMMVQSIIDNRLFPFDRCIMVVGEITHYFEYVKEEDRVIVIVRNPDERAYASALITLNGLIMRDIGDNYQLEATDVRPALFAGEQRIPLAENHFEEIKAMMLRDFIGIVSVFKYINSVSLEEPELETKAVKKSSKKSSKQKKVPMRYISTRKYVLTGLEKKSKKAIPRKYTLESWQVRGHCERASRVRWYG